jgi:hypothetical protein
LFAGEITERIVRESLEPLGREVFEPVLGRPVMEHALGDRDDVAGIDHSSSAENSALQDIDRKVVRGSSGSVHVELIVHRAIALGSPTSWPASARRRAAVAPPQPEPMTQISVVIASGEGCFDRSVIPPVMA